MILGLEMSDFWASINSYRDQLHRSSRPIVKANAKTISLGSGDLYMKSNFQDFQRFPDIDLAIAADAETTMPALIEQVRRLVNGEQKAIYEARGKKLAAEPPRRLRARARPTRPMAGTPARSVPRDFAWRYGPRSRTRTGRWSRRRLRSAIGRSGCGPWTSPTISSAMAAAWASAIAPRQRPARRSPTASTGGCRSRCRTTAIC